ncbi:hypothetical protein M6D81_25565 [Paenibacillus sp. J5C_2022]|uniref:hypothetical protein n=1 Tax=Paenibacillus sp. J5C2022 TaxID=2977129 RepID=UPI0021D277E0|nr:hypothetical protein [Paenibacillus sp. J5C2022]MCU6712071.1 hypothetical protein [Paenibacillus sp. J5C2022]
MSSNSAIMYTPRLCDNETITNKLIYQIRQQQVSDSDMDRLQARCRSELHELRQELNSLLSELRSWLANDETEQDGPQHKQSAA